MQLLEISGLIFFLGLGAYLFIFGAKKYLAFTRLRKDGSVADAVVTGLKTAYLNYTAVISFVDDKNKRQEGTAKNTIQIKRFNNHRIGNRIKVYYDRKDPSNFVVDKLSDRLMPLYCCAIGAVFILTILYVIVLEII